MKIFRKLAFVCMASVSAVYAGNLSSVFADHDELIMDFNSTGVSAFDFKPETLQSVYSPTRRGFVFLENVNRDDKLVGRTQAYVNLSIAPELRYGIGGFLELFTRASIFGAFDLRAKDNNNVTIRDGWGAGLESLLFGAALRIPSTYYTPDVIFRGSADVLSSVVFPGSKGKTLIFKSFDASVTFITGQHSIVRREVVVAAKINLKKDGYNRVPHSVNVDATLYGDINNNVEALFGIGAYGYGDGLIDGKDTGTAFKVLVRGGFSYRPSDYIINKTILSIRPKDGMFTVDNKISFIF